MDGLVGQKVQEYAFKKKDQAVTLEAKDAVHTGTETVVIDPMLLFQHLVSAWTTLKGNLDEVLRMNFVVIHLHFLKQQMLYFPQTKLHSPMPCGNNFQICLAQQQLSSTFWMEVPFSTEFSGLVVRTSMQSVAAMFSM